MNNEALNPAESVLLNLPEQGKYQKFKETLLAHFTISKEKRCKKLMTGLQLGDRKPSMLLKEMESLGDNRLHADYLSMLGMQHLPSEIQVTLAAVKDLTNPAVAELADRIQDVRSPAVAYIGIAAVNAGKSANTVNEQVTLGDLVARIDALKVGFDELRRSRSPSLSKHRTRARSHLRTGLQKHDNELCYYRNKFDKDARKFRKPCRQAQPGN